MERYSILRHPIKRIKYDFGTDQKYNLHDSMNISIFVLIACFILSLLAIYFHYVRLVKLVVFAIIIILGYMTIHKVYTRLDHDWNDTSLKTRDSIYGLLLKMIGLYSIFILGTINFNPTKNQFNDYLSAFYISFIILADLVSISVTNNEIEHYLPKSAINKNYLKLHVPNHRVTDSKGNKLEIEKHNVKAKIIHKPN